MKRVRVVRPAGWLYGRKQLWNGHSTFMGGAYAVKYSLGIVVRPKKRCGPLVVWAATKETANCTYKPSKETKMWAPGFYKRSIRNWCGRSARAADAVRMFKKE